MQISANRIDFKRCFLEKTSKMYGNTKNKNKNTKNMQWWWSFIFVFLTVVFCEFLGDFYALWYCKWPTEGLKSGNKDVNNLNAMILADTHLLGPRNGHWLDKLYREWHMKRAFQTALLMHNPDVVFVLGDLFDEGDLVEHDEFKKYVHRFHRHFHAPSSIPVISAAGNHDVGFHYKMHSYFIDRFEENFNNTGVELYTIRGNHFVFINSMAMENDGCEFCDNAVQELHTAAAKLNCLKKPTSCTDSKTLEKHQQYSRPVVLQHFPTYRKSDRSCRVHDSPHIEQYREKWEVLSKNSTDWLGKLLHPRLSFAGHTHNYCFSINRWGVEEYTVASFSWRNKINPSFLMVSLNDSSHSVLKCDMLEQQVVYSSYIVASLFLLIFIIMKFLKRMHSTLKKKI